jgi:imidazolonepropionase-like amidohydrolase
MCGWAMHLALRDSVASGLLLGPTIITTGAIIDGDPPRLRGSAVAHNSSEADSIVGEQVRAGYHLIKVYDGLSVRAYHGIAAAAKRYKVRFVGHVPFQVGLQAAIEAGQSSIEHLSGFPAAALAVDTGHADWSRVLDFNKVRRLAHEIQQAGVWSTPTLVVLERGDMSAAESQVTLDRPELRYLPRSFRRFCCGQAYDAKDDLPSEELARRRDNRFMIVRALHNAGARILVGTDTGNPFVLPGYAVADELELLVSAGLSPYEALRAATHDAAEYLDGDEAWGTIEVGKRADLILLAANPLTDIGAVRKPLGVMVRGRWLPGEELRGLLEAQAKRNVNTGS